MDNSGDNLGITLFGAAYFAGGAAYFAGGTAYFAGGTAYFTCGTAHFAVYAAYFACITAKCAVSLNKLLFFSYHYGILKPIKKLQI